MKILHVADLHLEGGYNRVGSEKNKLLKAEGLDYFSQVLGIAESEHASAVLLCGDLFDRLSVRVSFRKEITNQIAAHPDIKFFYCLGNHDHKLLFEDEKPDNLIIFSTDFEKYDLGEVVIGGSSVLKFSRRDFIDKIDFDKNRLNILMLHAYLSSTSYDDCLSFEVKELKNKNIDYLALGHIHTRSDGKIDERGVWVYSGNGGKYGFGNYPKGCVILTIENGKISWERRDFVSKRNFVDAYVDISACQDSKDIEAAIKNTLKNCSHNDLVRVFLKGEYDEDIYKNIQYLIEKLSDDYFYFDIRDDSKLRIDIERLKNETLSLKAELIKLVLDRQDLTDEEKEKCIKLGISALRGEEVEV